MLAKITRMKKRRLWIRSTHFCYGVTGAIDGGDVVNSLVKSVVNSLDTAIVEDAVDLHRGNADHARDLRPGQRFPLREESVMRALRCAFCSACHNVTQSIAR